jgi:hypothetical protein
VDLDVIIVNWNGGDLLRDCLRSLRDVRAPFAITRVVVDNDSRDGSPGMVERDFPEVRLIRAGANLGFGRGNNLARAHVAAPAVLFLNPDTTVPDGALQAMVDVLERQADVGAVGCKMTDPDGAVVHGLGYQWFPTPWTEFAQLALLNGPVRRWLRPVLPTVDPARDAYVSKLYGGCLMVRREVLERVGWFDERFFMYAEDVDLCRRITDAGWKLFYASGAVIRHVAGGTSRKAPSTFSTLMKCESIAQLIEKYHGPGGRSLHRVALFAGSLLRLGAGLVLRVLALAGPAGRVERIRDAQARNLAILRWSLGLQRASVPA